MKQFKKYSIGIGCVVLVLIAFVVRQSLPTADDTWANILTPEQYAIMRQGGTERAFSNPLNAEKRAGTYFDATGTQALFRSEDKFDSGTGWPSFTKPIMPEAIITKKDWGLGIPRTEVLSSKDLHHLGHVFTDGPEPTGLRYCMNGTALKFVADSEQI